ncbi:MAG: hypothetical protein JWQ38_809 [Flavipsychrobacter sp.]|nr:hypothetical protein [Flavipsychrobacter sp.]
MKTITLSAIAVLISSASFAQPVITTSMSTAPLGYADSVYSAPTTIAPGAGGAAVTWDFSTLPLTALGYIKLITPSTSPYASTFPTATVCAEISPVGSSTHAYSYEKVSSTNWEALANNYSGVGTGKDYTPNPQSFLQFPFHYTDNFVDAFQTTVGGPYNVTITYDGYGTLTTPLGTYTNVVRIKKYWGVGDYGYNWYATSPYLTIVASFDAQNNNYTFIGHKPPTAITQTATASNGVSIYPNPFSSTTTLHTELQGINAASITIIDMAGRIVRTLPLSGSETVITKGDMSTGMYVYKLTNNGSAITTGTFIIQ